MAITITDPVLTQAMANAVGTVDVQDAEGHVLGRFTAKPDGKLPAGFKLPWSEDEIRELQKQKTGRPLKDILRDLEARS